MGTSRAAEIFTMSFRDGFDAPFSICLINSLSKLVFSDNAS